VHALDVVHHVGYHEVAGRTEVGVPHVRRHLVDLLQYPECLADGLAERLVEVAVQPDLQPMLRGTARCR
jgi:hypothetical protein